MDNDIKRTRECIQSLAKQCGDSQGMGLVLNDDSLYEKACEIIDENEPNFETKDAIYTVRYRET